jgi:diaminopimelate epimerase
MAADGRSFWKLSGSGNDFVFLDARDAGGGADPLETTSAIQAICAPHLGVGADGVVFLANTEDADFGIRYYNADGTRATLCGNASLCSAQLAVRIGLAPSDRAFRFTSDAGVISATAPTGGEPTVRIAGVDRLEAVAFDGPLPDEHRVGYAVVGVPHFVVLVDDADAVDLKARAPGRRWSTSHSPAGANVNYVSGTQDGDAAWRVRTWERGVEGETLACGTGAVAVAACLDRWGLADAANGVALQTTSGRILRVRLPAASESVQGWSELTGEGRLVFTGQFRTLL